MQKHDFFRVLRAPARKNTSLFFFPTLSPPSKEKPTVETAGANDCLLYE